jgi:hypothetical protein
MIGFFLKIISLDYQMCVESLYTQRNRKMEGIIRNPWNQQKRMSNGSFATTKLAS